MPQVGLLPPPDGRWLKSGLAPLAMLGVPVDRLDAGPGRRVPWPVGDPSRLVALPGMGLRLPGFPPELLPNPRPLRWG